MCYLPENWKGAITAVSGSAGKKTLKFNAIRDLTLSEEIYRRELDLTSVSILSNKNRGRLASKQPTNCGKAKSKGKSKAC